LRAGFMKKPMKEVELVGRAHDGGRCGAYVDEREWFDGWVDWVDVTNSVDLTNSKEPRPREGPTLRGGAASPNSKV